VGVKEDMADWEWRATFLERCPQSEFDQLKAEIRAVWKDPEQEAYWRWRIADEAAFARQLLALSEGITERIIERSKAKP
jgi:hypothetical protein